MGRRGHLPGLGDQSAYPHISYCANDNDLKYAYQDASGWYIETVDAAGGWYHSLALDGGGYPHISYCGWSLYDLKYAYQDASGWHIETVEREGDVGRYTSLALDDNGYPHISYYYCGTDYYSCDVDDLKYAYRDASGWHIQTVDSAGWAATSLPLDAGGYPHISYFDDTNYDLKYAYQDASGWHIETVDAAGGRYTSLALDGGEYPHISYGGNDLKYAYYSAWTLYLPLILKKAL